MLTAADWTERAEEARQLAKGMKDECGREAMIGIAESYERLAEKAARAELVAAGVPED